MTRRNINHIAYQAIRIEGGLAPADELSRLTTLQSPNETEQTENHYGIPKGLKLRDEIARYWKIGQNLWADFKQIRQRQDINAHSVTVSEFLEPLFRDVLGFVDTTSGASIGVSDFTYNVGHIALGGRFPLVLVAHNQNLDSPAERFGELNIETGKTRRRSPFMLAQEALNASNQSLWAVTSNGLTLRILRDNPSLTRPAYVEVDLEAIFDEELYADFTAFWLLAHASRFGKPAAEPADCPWERWRAAGQETGVSIRGKLRYQVAEALRALGTGFLSHPGNDALRAVLQTQDYSVLSTQAFFEELLGLVYRFIFLATVEDRTDTSTGQRLIFMPATSPDIQQRYLEGYSLTWLRERAARRSGFDTHSDLWEALGITFNGLAQGESALGLPALGGLFEKDQCQHIANAKIENRWLLAAIFQLGYFREPTGLTRVNYRDMGPEELGSVYESLLELVPDVQSLSQPSYAKLTFVGDDDKDASTKGNSRKLTGSYYTPDGLVQELIKSALEPVIAETLSANPDRPVDALLELTVCDPACGSGHFLLSAARRLADEVAKLRAANGAPTQVDYRHALRDVVSRCIYGVDKNPMAVALAKTALWLEAYTPDRPLSFLDHHLQVGDALLGVLDPKILDRGIPDEAYTALSGDDKDVASDLKKQNKADLKSWKTIAADDMFTKTNLLSDALVVEQLDDNSLAGIAVKRDAWRQAAFQAEKSTLARLADTYVAAFLAPKLSETAAQVPVSGYLWGLIHAEQSRADVDSAAYQLCRTHSVFHWWLAFPQVAAEGGFSVMLGNPPWERIKLQEQEFFATRSPLVAMAKNKAERGERIKLLQQGLLLHSLSPDVEAAEGLAPPSRAEMQLHADFIIARRGAEAASLFAHNGGRFPLTGVGDVNTYALFAETFLQLASPKGRAGFIVPTGIATDDSTKIFFGGIAQGGRLVSLYDFENRERIFPAIDSRIKFSLITLGVSKEAQFVCFATQVDHLLDERRRFTLNPEEFSLINPNTRTSPVFRSKQDAALTKKLYRAAPVLITEAGFNLESGQLEPEVNPWGIRFSTMFHMSSDSDLFHDTASDIGQLNRLPLYEAKLMHQFDHRWATYVDAPDKPNGLDTKDCTDEQKEDPEFTVRPRYWVDEGEVLARIARVPSRVSKAWLTMHSVSPEIAVEAGQELILVIAMWVAGELFLQAVGAPDAEGKWTSTLRLRGASEAERLLSQRFPLFLRALNAAGMTSKKAPVEYSKWAAQNLEVRLSDEEFDALAACFSYVSEKQTSALLELLDAWMDKRSPHWLMGWRDITNATNERTVIASVVPRSGVGHTMPLFYSGQSPLQKAILLGNWSTLVFDYIARQKVGGTHLTYGYLKQFPVLPPEHYSESDFSYIVPRVLELTYTSRDLTSWAVDLGYHGKPFLWIPERRAQLRAELDAYYARLYGLDRDELRYILDPADMMGSDYPSETFRGLKANEERMYGEFRTRRLVLEAWDRLEEGMDVPGEMSHTFVYSPIGEIRNKGEADLAGLLVALIKYSTKELSSRDIQGLVVKAITPGYAAAIVDKETTERLATLVAQQDVLLTGSPLELIPGFLRHLVDSQVIAKNRVGDTALFKMGSSHLPPDVNSGAELDELARMMLMLDTRSAEAQRLEVPSPNQTGKATGTH